MICGGILSNGGIGSVLHLAAVAGGVGFPVCFHARNIVTPIKFSFAGIVI
jgi:hypothetical protein